MSRIKNILMDLIVGLRPGDRAPDGTIYAGISPDTGQPMYTTPSDVPITMNFRIASDYAKDMDAYDHQDWRLPTGSELKVLFNNRAAIGGFNESGSYPEGWYWSSLKFFSTGAWAEQFDTGRQFSAGHGLRASVRCVR